MAAAQRLHPYIGLHVTGNASMDYVAPSVSAGADYRLKKRLLLSGYMHYFKTQRTDVYADIGTASGHFKAITAALLAQRRFSKNERRYFFGAIGLAAQQIDEDYTDIDYHFDDRRRFITPAFRIGYAVPAFRHQLAFELNATGPNSYTRPLVQTTEILTLLSLSMRIIF